MPPNTQAILYSFRRCPYAMRARMALRYSGTEVELREVVLKDKPAAMLAISPKGTVPVLAVMTAEQADQAPEVIDESLDIMRWALQQHDPDNWLDPSTAADGERLIATNDGEFKRYLDRYKYFERYPEASQTEYFDAALVSLEALEQRLRQHPYLLGERCRLADIAIFPFIRQFHNVDPERFAASGLSALGNWLQQLLSAPLFEQCMKKYPAWQAGATPTRF